MRTIPRPPAGEFPPFASDYVEQVPGDGQVLDHLRENADILRGFVRSLPAEQLTRPYAPGKWTIQETVVHILDAERILACRALRFARGDRIELPGFDQDAHAAVWNANQRSSEGILEEYTAVRRSTIALFEGLDESALTRGGTVEGNPLSVRGALYFIAGHELVHLRSLEQRYGASRATG